MITETNGYNMFQLKLYKEELEYINTILLTIIELDDCDIGFCTTIYPITNNSNLSLDILNKLEEILEDEEEYTQEKEQLKQTILARIDGVKTIIHKQILINLI